MTSLKFLIKKYLLFLNHNNISFLKKWFLACNLCFFYYITFMMNNNKQRGFGILGLVLTMVVLIASVSFMILKGTDTSNVLNTTSVTNTLVAQAGLIRSRILACGIEYPAGNNGTSYRTQYPAGTAATNASALTCPGAANANIWTLLDGLNAPNTVSGFGNWQYYNDGTNMRITIVANTQDRINMLNTLVRMLGPQASITGGNTIVWILVN